MLWSPPPCPQSARPRAAHPRHLSSRGMPVIHAYPSPSARVALRWTCAARLRERVRGERGDRARSLHPRGPSRTKFALGPATTAVGDVRISFHPRRGPLRRNAQLATSPFPLRGRCVPHLRVGAHSGPALAALTRYSGKVLPRRPRPLPPRIPHERAQPTRDPADDALPLAPPDRPPRGSHLRKALDGRDPGAVLPGG